MHPMIFLKNGADAHETGGFRRQSGGPLRALLRGVRRVPARALPRLPRKQKSDLVQGADLLHRESLRFVRRMPDVFRSARL